MKLGVLALIFAVPVVAVGGYTATSAFSQQSDPTVTTETFTFTNEGVATYTIPTETETVTETVTGTMPTEPPPPPPPPPPAPPPPPGPEIIVEGSYVCNGPVDFGLLKITQHSNSDALVLAAGCTGRIGRVEIDTWTQDGIKVQNASENAAHDIVFESGYVVCHDIAGGAHQDGMQAMGGARITGRRLYIDCLGNSNWFVNRAGSNATMPTDIVCEDCVFNGNSSTTVRVNVSVRSGARGSIGCVGRNVSSAFFFVNYTPPPDRAYVNEGNQQLPHGDAGCVR